ncbi:hypothetical protein S40285_01032 [Stachybotrys chlorohalonatus IBT 40285]|uniref:Uncharacterized protein n=1 Tax=Stachybotrys chlorohalonatus (strain IBT 40285) TaxID=1283841 RepID=A0A084QKA1_STAC4|nr:hypothetical protein S40285_01032 [Stachybotrys chlorohalonata IBT 40285]
MAPSRPNDKKSKQDAGQTPSALLADAETLLAVGNFEEGIPIAQKALEITGEGGDFELRALNLLGMLHIETGDVEEAYEFFERAVKLDPEGEISESVGGGPEKFLFLAQLSEEGGQDSVRWFERGASSLRKQIQALSDSASKSPEQDLLLQEKQQRLGGVLCAVAEVYMTDLSWEDDAETRCEALITEAMMIAPNSPETWQTVANVRISQERVDDAKRALERSLEIWKDLPPEHPSVPEFPTRIALARLLLEVEMEDEALKVLERLTSDDDTSVEAWYLGGWCLYIMGQKLQETKQQQNGDAQDDWKAVWLSSRKWLAHCLRLYELQEYEDERLGSHAVELYQSINKELGEPTEGEDEEWEDASDDEDDEDHDGDQEMKG